MYAVTSPFESRAVRTAVAFAPLPAGNRSHGRAEIAFGLRAGRTALESLYQEGCIRILRPEGAPGTSPQAVLLNTAGGLTGGDTMQTEVGIGRGAGVVITSQAAEKIYRAADGDARVTAELRVAEGGWLTWLPQETILFDGARLVRDLRLHVARGARALVCEALVFGRQARKESMRSGLLQDSWRLFRDGRLAWADLLRLEDDVAGILARPTTADGAIAMASVLYVADDADKMLDVARDLAGCAHVTAAATAMGSVLLARFAADSLYALRAELVPFLKLFVEAADIPAALPRIWAL